MFFGCPKVKTRKTTQPKYENGRWFHQGEGGSFSRFCSGHSFWHELYPMTRVSKPPLSTAIHFERSLQISSLRCMWFFTSYDRHEIQGQPLKGINFNHQPQVSLQRWTSLSTQESYVEWICGLQTWSQHWTVTSPICPYIYILICVYLLFIFRSNNMRHKRRT